MQSKNSKRMKDVLDKGALLSDFDTVSLLDAMLNDLIPLSENDLVNIENVKSYSGYYAFSVPIPVNLIKEAVSLAKQTDNYLSRLVLKYPYIQLIVEYWIINKLYDVYKNDPNIIGAANLGKDYKSFNNYLSYHYLPYEEYETNQDKISMHGYSATFESIAQLISQLDGKRFRTLSFKPESEFKNSSKDILYDVSSWDFAVNKLYRETDFTLYDFIYDVFYNGICKALRGSFKSDMITKLLPLSKSHEKIFRYEEINFEAMYGSDIDRELFPRLNRKVTRLACMCPKLQPEESLIVKSAPNQFMYGGKESSYNFQNDYYNPKLGMVYDELWEVCGRSIEKAKANKDEDEDDMDNLLAGEVGLYQYSFYSMYPRPPLRAFPEYISDKDGNIIEEIDTYNFKETEARLGTKFYYTHNFHVTTPAFYIYRKLYGYDWDRIFTIRDDLMTVTNNLAVPSLYFKYAGIQLILLSFLNSYGWCDEYLY